MPSKEPQEEEDTIFQIGDRVILQGLKKAAQWNGRHGAITGELTKAGRYPVDVDLWDPESMAATSLAVKLQNLKREPAIPPDTERATVTQGILTEDYGRPLSYMLDLVRFLAARFFFGPEHQVEDMNEFHQLRATPMGLMKMNQYIATAWSHWLDPGAYHTPDNQGVYELFCDWAKKPYDEIDGIPQGELAAYEKAAYEKVGEAAVHRAAAKSWHIRVHGAFWVVGMDDEGTYLVAAQEESAAPSKRVYQVVGVRSALYPMCVRDFPRPVLMKLTMLPFYGRLVYDGVCTPAGYRAVQTGRPAMASVALAERLFQTVETAKAQGCVIQCLRQLEVPGGSSEGLTKIPTKVNDSTKKQEEPTAEEQELVQALSKCRFEPTVRDSGILTMRRLDYTEEENPNHIVTAMCNGMMLGMFTTEKLEPTSCEILQQVVQMSEANKHPNYLMIEEAACYRRVKFLLKDLEGTAVEYYMPPTKEETAAYRH